MSDQLSKVVAEMREHGTIMAANGRDPSAIEGWADRIESAATPAEVEGKFLTLPDVVRRETAADADDHAMFVEYCATRLTEKGLPMNAKTLHESGEFIRTLARQLAEANERMRELEAQRDDYLNREWIAEKAKRKAESQLAEATRRLGEVEGLLRRYRDEVPLGHQPHMIAHLVDDLLTKEPTK